MRKLIGAMLLVVLALPVAVAAAGPVGPVGLTVTGVARKQAPPDMATLSLGVLSAGADARRAMQANSAAVARVLGVLRAAGVAARDLQTTGLSLAPRWSRPVNGSEAPPRIIGFQARNTVSVRLRDLAGLGRVLDQALQAGANNFNGMTFGLQQPQPLADAARRAAMADALRKAHLYAGAANVTLGAILSITETGPGAPRPQAMRSLAAMAVPVAAGEISVSASVTVVFAILPRP